MVLVQVSIVKGFDCANNYFLTASKTNSWWNHWLFEITIEIMREKLGEATGASVIAGKGLDGANNYFPPFLSSLPQVALLCCCYVATANFPLNLMQHSTSRGQNSASLPVATSKLPAAEHFTFSIFLVASFSILTTFGEGFLNVRRWNSIFSICLFGEGVSFFGEVKNYVLTNSRY